MMNQDANHLPAVCFLLGLPRSGTTLLAHLLQSHPDILAPPEPWLMLALEAFGRVDHRHPAGTSMVQAATSEFLGRIDRTGVTRAFADAAYGQYLAAAGKRTLIDKTPRYWTVLDFLDLLYPEAPRIVLMRNPYAIAASLKSTWAVPLLAASSPPAIASCVADIVLGRPTPAIASSLADLVLGLPALAAYRSELHTQVVQYEVLVTRPDEEIRRVIAGLGHAPMDMSSAPLAQTEYLRSSTFGDRKILEKKTVDDRSVQAWQTELCIEEMQVVTDLVGAQLLIELGYEQDLRFAEQAGVVDKGPEVTEGYRQLFRSCWNFLEGKTGGSFDIAASEAELNSIGQQAQENSLLAFGPSILLQAQRLAASKSEENLRIGNSIAAELTEALMAAKAAQDALGQGPS
ncbi:sulfotransferase [Bradyrhizobium sp. CIAT3101]|uniref:nodulation protein NoeE n=1 Tax=Bradyrhizobium sp. CIAT3101 TaxID=439387 RepID=UPI0024B20C83|nr:sulfotransferase [Bradyrhizobium sp. CIAT3101]WFU80621.1 sulfotransferase [Bradyrhizobium sp. CIAT3101]